MAASLPPTAAELLTSARHLSGLTKSAFARAAGTSRSALDQYEKGDRVPRYDTLTRALQGTGRSLLVSLSPDQRPGPGPTLSLASFVSTADTTDPRWMWRMLISDFVANEFVPAGAARRFHLLARAPGLTGHPGWDSLVAALAEHLAFHAEAEPPTWTSDDARYGLDSFWWPVHGTLASMRASALVHSPASFKRRLILVDGRELPRVRR